MRTKFLTVIFIIALNSCISFCIADNETDWKIKIQGILNNYEPEDSIQGLKSEEVTSVILKFYADLSYLPYWHEGEKLNHKVKVFQRIVSESIYDGLRPADYTLERILMDSDLVRRDILLTLSVLKLAADARFGRYKIRQIDSQNIKYNNLQYSDLRLLLKELSSSEDLAVFMKNLYPRHSQYLRMKNALREYREKEMGERTCS